MSIHYGRRAGAQGNTLQVDVMPAPTRGIDARAPTGNMPPDVCVYTYNLLPAEYGMLLRDGYREWCIDLESTSSLGVYTMMAHTGSDPGLVDDKLFAVTNEGIWDVTTYNTPSLVQAFGTNQEGAGHGVYCSYIDQGGSDFLYYADALNGLYIYDGDTDTWAPAAGITGPSLPSVAFVMVHKQRMWLIEEGKSSAWYLPIASGQGEATEFFFGGKFPHGGRCLAMYNWSLDGGSGIDDLLVVISSSGDVVVYQGEDPSSATDWKIRGTYYIGDIPTGRRIGSEYSGDLYLLSSFGLISMGDLVKGVDTQNPAANSLAFRISKPLRNDLIKNKTELGWEPIFLPPIGQILVTTPQVDPDSYIQYSLNLSTEGWGLWRGVPMLSIQDWAGKVYFGTKDNKVMVMDVTRDNVTIAEPPEGENGIPIEFSILSSTQSMGSPGIFKRVTLARPDFYGTTTPPYELRVLYDYDILEPPAPSAGAGEAAVGALWDVGIWDLAVWSTQQGGGIHPLGGTNGVGRSVSVAMRGTSGTSLRLLSWDVMWTTGGPV